MITVSRDGTGDFLSIQAAVDALPEEAAGSPREILIRRGIYHERVAVHRNNVRLIGEDAEETVITGALHATGIYRDGTERTTFRSWTLLTSGRDVEIRNLTVRNDAGDGRDVGQAVAVYAAGDRGIWRNCRLAAHQDTLYCGPLRIPDVTEELGDRRGCAEAAPLVQNGPLSQSRQYFEHCRISGDVDFIFGSYRCWFERCTLFMESRGGWYTAANTNTEQPHGFVFHRCRLTGDCAEGKAFLGRPWRAGARTVYLACDMDEHVAPEGFADWDENRVVTERYGEWGTTGLRADQSVRHHAQKRLTDAEAAEISLQAVLGGEDGWKPA